MHKKITKKNAKKNHGKNAKNFGLRSGCVGGAANGCSTRRRDPATAHRGDFWLLGFPPGPVRLALANLDPMGYPAGSILTTSLARTSVQRGTSRHSCPHLKPSTQSDLRAAGLQERAAAPGRMYRGKHFYLNAVKQSQLLSVSVFCTDTVYLS